MFLLVLCWLVLPEPPDFETRTHVRPTARSKNKNKKLCIFIIQPQQLGCWCCVGLHILSKLSVSQPRLAHGWAITGKYSSVRFCFVLLWLLHEVHYRVVLIRFVQSKCTDYITFNISLVISSSIFNFVNQWLRKEEPVYRELDFNRVVVFDPTQSDPGTN